MFSKKTVDSLKRGSLVRAMFEEGEKLRKIYGADNVYDLSIGNPEFEPPQAFKDAYTRIVLEHNPNKHRYMPNAGYEDVRGKIAAKLTKESGVSLTANNIIMTCGAAAAMNVAFRSLLNPGEEVIVLSPFFMEYIFYIEHNNGVPVIAPTNSTTFEPDAGLLEKYITPKTKAIIINNPNNPTGVVYSEDSLKKVSQLLEQKEKEFNTSIYVMSDEPYAAIVYDGVKVPSTLKVFRNAISINSFSKSLALPGERIGYIAASSNIENVGTLINAMVLCNRTLGFVNAPAVMQKAVAEVLDAVVDLNEYKKRRDILYNHLTEIGFSCIKPQGAFYLFPKTPIEDDVEFTRIAMKHRLLVVPGSGFGTPGHVRLAYCLSMKTIENCLPAFTEVAKEFIK
jgi:aspartate aminotransferase